MRLALRLALRWACRVPQDGSQCARIQNYWQPSERRRKERRNWWRKRLTTSFSGKSAPTNRRLMSARGAARSAPCHQKKRFVIASLSKRGANESLCHSLCKFGSTPCAWPTITPKWRLWFDNGRRGIHRKYANFSPSAKILDVNFNGILLNPTVWFPSIKKEKFK